MGSLRVDLDQCSRYSAPENLQTALKVFFSDMKSGKSEFYNLPTTNIFSSEYDQIKSELSLRFPEINTFVQLGIGGSSLGPEALIDALSTPSSPRFVFVDHIDPDALHDLFQALDLKRTLFYVVSKSGKTLETAAQFLFFYNLLSKSMGESEAKKRFVFCTDPKKGSLRELAQQWHAPVFSIPENLGGRFSVLSAVGFFPALVAGIDHRECLSGAEIERTAFESALTEGLVPQALDLAVRLVSFYKQHQRNVTVLMPYSRKLKAFAAWFVQLWGESLGKDGKGMTPVAAIGPTDQHSLLQLLRDGPQDKVIGFVEVAGFRNVPELKWTSTGSSGGPFDLLHHLTINQLMDAELNATRQSLSSAGRPHFSLCIPKISAQTMGQLFYFFELVTALAGYLMEIDPFNQPGVEEGKILTIDRINACKKSSIV